jgi:Uma2 family endonuclease
MRRHNFVAAVSSVLVYGHDPDSASFRKDVSGRRARLGDRRIVPSAGFLDEDEYLALKTKHLVEFDNGTIEVLPLPTKSHQIVVLFLYELLKAFITGRSGGRVLVAPYRLRVPTGKYREPDVMYLTPEQDARAGDMFAESAELVMEVVSPDAEERDYVKKRRDYADLGIPEYWIVDRIEQQIVVLRLENGDYVEHGRFGPGRQATSYHLTGFVLNTDDVLA